MINIKPKISIVVPIYNAEIYLEECINSLINQTEKNIEIILINDGSTDSSGKICDNYAMKDSRIKVIHKINEGQAVAKNIGIDLANGEYIGFLDSDDYIKKTMYEKLYNIAIKYDCDLVGCKMVDQYGKSLYNYFYTPKYIYSNNDLYTYIYPWYFKGEIESFSANKIYKLKILKDNNIKFPLISHEEDTVLNMLFFEQCKKFIYIDEALYIYRQHFTNITTKINMNKYKSMEYLLNYKMRISRDYFNNEYNDLLNNIYSNDILKFIEKIYYFNDETYSRLQMLEIISKNEIFKKNIQQSTEKINFRYYRFLLMNGRYKLIIFSSFIKIYPRVIIKNIVHFFKKKG